ncbi:family 65 glycosyl hydrolase domain-containing protein [Sphingobacterium tabacisoli]|uniref:Family 65 glycosyl hydrolase domain-containing protein n=1 Tax=Sphingobacterium tabacisoli TaxID=2044855 RepID=A0ABW5L7I9_9SPHI|nr:family 65 glycosyl hydrolase domain-containing protein [Sphingobacterium tabacisoli]
MKDYLTADEWCIIEDQFLPEYHKISESIFSIGNGKMGQRANFEENYTGESLTGNYIAGLYYPDKTRVGWWKNGYPEYFAKVLNSPNWIGLNITVGSYTLDLHKVEISKFQRVLNMKDGYLKRCFEAKFPNGKIISVNTVRFYSMDEDDIGALEYSITPLNFSGIITVESYLDGDVKNEDANYDEKFWEKKSQHQTDNLSFLTQTTKKTNFSLCTGTATTFKVNNKQIVDNICFQQFDQFLSHSISLHIEQGNCLSTTKYASNISSLNHPENELQEVCHKKLEQAQSKGFKKLLEEQAASWSNIWASSDIIIDGDLKAQQAIRFNIFQLKQTYTGRDSRLNIGPKGFTGEKYGGSTYWDTEAYCLPFFLGTSDQSIARNLLKYRYNHLQKAIDNAQKLGFTDGAALYPMVTMTGDECHNEWEITFEEIHRNGAIAFAIYNYTRYTNDHSYLEKYGLEVLIAIARFWKQRVNWSIIKNKYVILGVTGPNEYENNVNNNWYTNKIASWCLAYTKESLLNLKQKNNHQYTELLTKTNLNEDTELADWEFISKNMYFPEDNGMGLILQQDDYLEKEQLLVKDLPVSERPIHQHWSWDRILRSCFIKQADVLQGLYFFEEEFELESIRRNFDFYEARTVHESSLSPCIHSILAARLGQREKAYALYLRTARLDLDDYNNDTEDGLHITSMAGTWMSIVEGFAGTRVKDDSLHFNPFLPTEWSGFSFNLNFRNQILKIEINQHQMEIENTSDQVISIHVKGKKIEIKEKSVHQIEL